MTKYLVRAMKGPKPLPTELELEILKVIWDRGRATVREVYQDLQQQRKIAYTTVLTMMGILERKGHLRKTAGEKAYVYSPADPRAKVLDGMVKEFINRVFNGSAQPLLVHLMERRGLSDEELDQVEALIRKQRPKS
jgi:BlaI family penicillinase repressor